MTVAICARLQPSVSSSNYHLIARHKPKQGQPNMQSVLPASLAAAGQMEATGCKACAGFTWTHGRRLHLLMVDLNTSKVNFLSIDDDTGFPVSSGWHGRCRISCSSMSVQVHWRGNEQHARSVDLIWHPGEACFLDRQRVVRPILGPMATL